MQIYLIKSMTFAVRMMIILLIVMHGLIGFAIAAQKANAATLKSVSVVESNVITVSDIFDGITRNAEAVIGPAPAPGQDVTFNARTLYRIANAMNIEWRPQTMTEQITIRREATIISPADIRGALKKELGAHGVHGAFDIALHTSAPSMVLPASYDAQVEISSFNFDAQRDLFTATLVAPSKANPIERISLSGKVERLVKVPVMIRNLQNGDLISESDIDFMMVDQTQLQHDVILSTDSLIGMTPRRMLYAGKFILDGSLQKPEMVARGDQVTLYYKSGPLTLSAKGRALQSGAKGDLVRIKNMNSSRPVDGIVIGSNEVMVQ